MTRHVSVTGLPRCAGPGPLWFWGGLGALLLVLAGCSQTTQHRAQSAEETELQRYDLATIGDRTSVGNAEFVPLGGVGLVEGLDGTGGDCQHDSYRNMLADNLRKEGVQHVNQVLSSPEYALVIVEASIPPGAVKGDRLDVEVKLPPGSRATSLRGGRLHKCYLFNYEYARNLRPSYNGGANLLSGHPLAVAEGSILVGVGGDDEEQARVKQGRVWQGARLRKDNPLALVMNLDSQQARLTSLIADRINGTFQAGGLRGSLDTRLAYTRDNQMVALNVPPQYRQNLQRYLRVVRTIPLSELADTPPKQGDDRRSYRQKLADDLLDPARTVVAAIRLEALGQKSIPALKAGLKNTHPLVRFASAEALAYLGSAAGCEELGKAVAEHPVLRAHALAALASLDEAASLLKLKELMLSDVDEDARYGAFRALFLLNEREPLVRGERLNESFWLHRVAPGSRPVVHLSTAKRAEVVIFGETPRLKPPFSFLAGEFAITATEDSTATALSRVPLHGGPARKMCSLELEDVVRGIAELGGGYSEVLSLLQQASACDSLSCPVRIDALPQPTDVHELVRLGKDPTGKELRSAPASDKAAR